ncbi:MAG: hypothetical protein AAF799_42800 [Myxococcota bacterium]
MRGPIRLGLRRVSSAALALALAWPVAAHAQPAETAPPAEAPPEPQRPPSLEADAPAPEAPPEAKEDAEPGPDDGRSVESLTPEELARRQEQIRIDNAQLHYQKAGSHYERGEYAEAAVEYELSYAAVPGANTLYNVALSHERAGEPVAAVKALRRYLALPDCAELAPAERTIRCTSQREDAARALAKQRRLVGELQLDPAKGVELREIKVGGRTVPLDDFPILLLPGEVDVEFFGIGSEQGRLRVARIKAGQTSTLYVAPFRQEVVVTPPQPPGNPDDELRRQQQRQRALRATFWIGTGLTATSGVALAVMGGLTVRERRDFIDSKCERLCQDPNGQPLGTGFPLEQQANFERYKSVTNALVGVTVALGVTTALVGVFAFRKRNREQARVIPTGPGLAVRW